MTDQKTLDTAKVMVDFNQMKSFGQDPLVLERGVGVRVWDVFGKEYIDGLSGVFTVNLGHGMSQFADVAAEQMRTLSFSAPTMSTNPPAIKLAEYLCSLVPDQFNTVKFASGGSEANEFAIKMARQYHAQTGNPRKYKVISRWGSYHGSTGFAGAASAQPEWKSKYDPYPEGFIHVPRRTPEDIEEAIVGENAESIAAVIAEPVMLSAGVRVPDPDYFPKLREICDRHNVLLIFDEIITGFGRTGHIFAAEMFGVWPDILSCGKGISGGYAPLAAILIADKVANAFWGDPAQGIQFLSGHTYGGNPVSCAVGEAVVRYLVENDVVGNAQRVGGYLADGLRDLGERQPAISEVRGMGMMRGLAFHEPIGRAVYSACRRNGLLTRPAHDWIGVAPPLVTTEQEADEIIAIIEKSIPEALAG
ncbi:MAG: aspartate aminotransferase family protein [Thermomicrobiales bacterium]|nr:aspartate aminotransferase family protein [Thermomicrobiales bacterium]